MGSKKRPKSSDFDLDSYDDYEDEFDNDQGSFKELSKDFYSTDWEDPSGSEKRFSTRRRIERRNDLKDLYSQFDDWGDIEIPNEW